MTDSRYVLIGRNRFTKELEPIHPGHMDRAEAERAAAELMALVGIRVDIKDADEWEREQDEANADLYCPVCGMMKEDCSEHEYEQLYAEAMKEEEQGHFTQAAKLYERAEALKESAPAAPAAGPRCPECGLPMAQLTLGDGEPIDQWVCPVHGEPAVSDIEWADKLDELKAQEQERVNAAIDEEARLDAVVPDLSDPQAQGEALDLLIMLQGHDFGHGSGNIYVARMLTAIHNKLHDEWAQKVRWDADKGHFIQNA